jgi:hypothetical protein
MIATWREGWKVLQVLFDGDYCSPTAGAYTTGYEPGIPTRRRPMCGPYAVFVSKESAINFMYWTSGGLKNDLVLRRCMYAPSLDRCLWAPFEFGSQFANVDLPHGTDFADVVVVL